MGWLEPLIADKVFGGGDSGGDGGDPGYARKPLPSNPQNREATLGKYANLSALYSRLGRTVPGWIQRRLNNNGNPSATMDFTGDFNPSDAASLRGVASQAANRNIRPGVWGNKVNQVLGENTFNREQQDWTNEYEPKFNSAIDRAQSMVDTPTISAQNEQNARGQIAATIRGDLEKNLRTTAATFGMRNLSPSSPAGAAVSARMALEADTELSRTLSGYGLQVSDINRQDQQRSMGLLSDLVSKKLATEHAIHDPAALIELNNQTSALLEALRTREEDRQFQMSMYRDANQRDWLGMGLNLAGQVAGVAAGAGAFGGKSSTPTSPSGWNSNWGASQSPFYGSTSSGGVSYSGR